MPKFTRVDAFVLLALAGAAVVIAAAPEWAANVAHRAWIVPGIVLFGALALYGTRATARLESFARPRRSTAESPASPIHPFELERFTHFAESLMGAVDRDSLRDLLRQRLPGLLGTSEIWLLIGDYGWQDVISATDDHGLSSQAGGSGWESFVLTADRKRVGLLGLRQREHPITDEQRRVVALVCRLIGAALKNARQFEDVRELGTIDPLTGCLVRHATLQRLTAEAGRAARTGQSLTVVALVIDDLEAITAQHGPDCAARVIVRVGSLLQETVRVSDVRCQITPTQFLILLPDTSLEGGKRTVEHLTDRMHVREFRCGATVVPIQLRAGLTQTEGEMNPEVLIDRALQALRPLDPERRRSFGSPGLDRRSFPGGGRRNTDVRPKEH